mmetsp:Transcript_34305/g.79979  ORF Transcript_34305/g.79979 Transcript_34305/m.79979 type:complete len:253 (-) Transcript_34305:5840-6598(-)
MPAGRAPLLCRSRRTWMAAKRASGSCDFARASVAGSRIDLQTACENFGISRPFVSHSFSRAMTSSELTHVCSSLWRSLGQSRTASVAEILLSQVRAARNRSVDGFWSSTRLTSSTLCLAVGASPRSCRLASHLSAESAVTSLAQRVWMVVRKLFLISAEEAIHRRARSATCLEAARPTDWPFDPTTRRSTNFRSTLTLFTTMRSIRSPTRYFFQSAWGTLSLPSFSQPKLTYTPNSFEELVTLPLTIDPTVI